MPTLNPNPVPYRGCFDDSVANIVNGTFAQLLVGSTTPVTITNPTVATDMMTTTLLAGTLEDVGETLEVFAAGTYLVAAASTLVFTVKIGGVTVATFTTASQATTAVTLGWNLTLNATVVTNGAAGSLEVHGELNFDSGATLAAACSTFLDSNTAAATGVNLNLPVLVEVMGNLGTGNAGSSITQRQLVVEYFQ